MGQLFSFKFRSALFCTVGHCSISFCIVLHCSASFYLVLRRTMQKGAEPNLNPERWHTYIGHLFGFKFCIVLHCSTWCCAERCRTVHNQT